MMVLLIALITSATCSIVGVFLVLRKMGMIVDAISHTILLGIVLGFTLTKSLTSPFLIVGAAAIGLVTVYLIELLVKSRRMNEDAATGIIFPLLFSIAVIMISLEFSHVHLDIDMVLVGNILVSSFEPLIIHGVYLGPKMLYLMGGVLLLNALFVTVFYKELKIVSFDPLLASVLGFAPFYLHYALMALVSLTAVLAFHVMGTILVIALMIGPAISALMLTKNLHWTIINSVIIAAIDTTIGYYLALLFDVSVSGMIATITLLVFLLIVSFAPRKGVLIRLVKRKKLKDSYAMALLLLHLFEHQASQTVGDLTHAFHWPKSYCLKIIRRAKKEGYITNAHHAYAITERGQHYIGQQFTEG